MKKFIQENAELLVVLTIGTIILCAIWYNLIIDKVWTWQVSNFMSVFEFIQANENLSINDLLIKYANYRLDNMESKIPYDRNLWMEANKLTEKEFCKWYMDQRSRQYNINNLQYPHSDEMG